jgi:hypothetical protein
VQPGYEWYDAATDRVSQAEKSMSPGARTAFVASCVQSLLPALDLLRERAGERFHFRDVRAAVELLWQATMAQDPALLSEVDEDFLESYIDWDVPGHGQAAEYAGHTVEAVIYAVETAKGQSDAMLLVAKQHLAVADSASQALLGNFPERQYTPEVEERIARAPVVQLVVQAQQRDLADLAAFTGSPQEVLALRQRAVQTGAELATIMQATVSGDGH